VHLPTQRSGVALALQESYAPKERSGTEVPLLIGERVPVQLVILLPVPLSPHRNWISKLEQAFLAPVCIVLVVWVSYDSDITECVAGQSGYSHLKYGCGSALSVDPNLDLTAGCVPGIGKRTCKCNTGFVIDGSYKQADFADGIDFPGCIRTYST
jgi:hypothetical protein